MVKLERTTMHNSTQHSVDSCAALAMCLFHPFFAQTLWTTEKCVCSLFIRVYCSWFLEKMKKRTKAHPVILISRLRREVRQSNSISNDWQWNLFSSLRLYIKSNCSSFSEYFIFVVFCVFCIRAEHNLNCHRSVVLNIIPFISKD